MDKSLLGVGTSRHHQRKEGHHQFEHNDSYREVGRQVRSHGVTVMKNESFRQGEVRGNRKDVFKVKMTVLDV